MADIQEKCPAYLGPDGLRIRCMGIVTRTELSVRFSNRFLQRQWQEEYCFGNHRSCPMQRSRMLRDGTARICPNNRGVICPTGSSCTDCGWRRT